MTDLNFYIAGSGPYFDKVAAMNVPSNMNFLGHLKYPTEVKAFLDEGDICVHPSGLDACPLSVMEAQLMRKAIIATNVGGVPEVMADKNFLVEDGDTMGWIGKIRWLLDHPTECETIGANGRRFVEEKFSLERISRDLFEYLKNVANE